MRVVGVVALLCAMLTSGSAETASDCKAVDLKVEFLKEPLGIDTSKPRFSWRIEDSRRGVFQSKFRLRVASSLDKLNADQADIWDTIKNPPANQQNTATSETSNLVYAGTALKSAT